MYRVQYYCPRQASFWQDLTEGLIWKTPRTFPSLQAAQQTCDGLLWQYHSSRVIDLSGQVVYQI